MPSIRAILRLVFCGLALCCLTAAQTSAAGKPRWAFVGVWDRSMPQIDAACREAGVTATFPASHDFAHPAAGEDAAPFDIVFVLNLNAEDSVPLTQRLKEARTRNPQQRVLALDTRASQADLEKAGLLTPDETIIRYWRPNGSVNIQRLVRYCLVHYAGGSGVVEPPVLIPDSGYYDPDQADSFDTFDRYTAFKRSRQRWQEGAPVAVLLIQQSFWITRDLKVVDAQIRALEKHGLNAVVVFGDREENVAALTRAAKPDLLIEDRHGPMWQSGAMLQELNVPYLRPISMLASTVEEWSRDPRGLSHRDVGMFMALQESWGTIEPLVVGGLQANIQGFRLHEPIPDRVDAFAARAARWAALRRKPNADKKVAIIYYNKGLGQDDLMRGSPTGGFLDAPESLMRFLPALQAAGYTLDHLPANGAELIATMKRAGRNIGPWAQGDLEKLVDEGQPILIPLQTYRRWFETKLSEANRQAVIAKFGPPPGRIMVVTRNGEPQIVLPRIALGNLLLTPQPERGEKQDEKLLHSRDVPPPHNYLAFYWWLEEQFHADAIVHWGTHGTLELLPGKEAGLSKDDWSDICTSHLPVIDLWITDNLGEATLARRRSYAALVDHQVPPALNAGLQDEFKTLHDDIHKFRTLEPGVLKEEFRKTISERARAGQLEDPLHAEAPQGLLGDDAITRLDDHLHNLYESRTPLTLHVLGQPPGPAEMSPYLVNILGEPLLTHLAAAQHIPVPPPEQQQPARDAAARFLDETLASKPSAIPFTPELRKDVEFATEMRGRLQDAGREMSGLIGALNGHYLEPGPGPEPIRNPASVPTGRNLYSLNPEEIPNRAAWEVGCRLVDDLLRTRHPRKIAVDLNGMETMRDFGVMEAQILYLLGVRPIWNRSNLVVDVELIPAEELKRPRVDVFIAMGGMYKENFPSRVALLDKAVRLAASAQEEDNAVREGVQSVEKRLLACGFSSVRAGQFAAARIFGTKPGNMSGTHILYLVPRSGVWDKDSEIADVYMDNMSFVYTQDAWGEKIDGLYEEALQGTDTVLRVWASNMTSQLSNHHAYEYLGGLNMAVKKVTGKTPAAVIADVRDPHGARIRDFEEVLAVNFRSELLNRRWIEGMMSHDYAGAGHIAELTKNTFGWSVTRRESVSPQVWTDIYEIYVKDRYQLGLDAWFEKVSPHAAQEMAATLLEAARKGLWPATREQVQELARRYAESVQRHGDSGGLVSGGNTRLVDYAGATLNAGGDAAQRALADAMKQSIEKSTAATGEDKVAGQKLELSRPAKNASPAPTPPTKITVQATTPWLTWERAVIALCGILLLLGFARRTGAP
jgi:cobaltochelatase CobN